MPARMKLRFAAVSLMALGVSLVLWCAPGSALLSGDRVTPDWTEQHCITMQALKGRDGTIAFTVTRYLDKAPQYSADSPLTTVRSASLEISDGKRVIANTAVAGEPIYNNVVYKFSVSPDFLKTTRFTLWERPSPKDPDKHLELRSGGTFYDFDLSEFAAPILKPRVREHP